MQNIDWIACSEATYPCFETLALFSSCWK